VVKDEMRGLWSLLYEALRALSEDPGNQIAWLGDMHPYELGLVFDDIFPVVPALVADGVVSSDRALSVLQEIDDALNEMSGQDNAALWTHDAIRRREEWARVRSLAREALALLPPSP
jgi:hypothetical protein